MQDNLPRYKPLETGVTLEIRSPTEPLRFVSELLGFRADESWDVGEETESQATDEQHYSSSIWRLRSELHLTSDCPSDHLQWMVGRVEPHKTKLQRLSTSDGITVCGLVTFVAPTIFSKFSVSSETFQRFAACVERIDFLVRAGVVPPAPDPF